VDQVNLYSPFKVPTFVQPTHVSIVLRANSFEDFVIELVALFAFFTVGVLWGKQRQREDCVADQQMKEGTYGTTHRHH
jgi:hypothetical protein